MNNDKGKGLYEKYRVERLNDEAGKHKYCTYFVLDLAHDKYSSVALEAYAKACEGLPQTSFFPAYRAGNADSVALQQA